MTENNNDLNKIKFSIIIPMYNSEKYIQKCIFSVLNQTYSNYEIIIVNDGSTDNSRKIVETIQKKENKIFIINQSNHGLLFTRRIGIANAKGEYIVFLDSDDTLVGNALMEIYNTILSNNADLILYKFQKINEKDVFIEKQVHPLENANYTKDQLLYIFFSTASLNNIWGKCIKTSLIKKDILDYFSIGSLNMAEDRLQSIFPLFKAEKIFFLNGTLYNYRINNESLTARIQKKGLLDIDQAFKIACDTFIDELPTKYFAAMITFDTKKLIEKYLTWIASNKISYREKRTTLKILTKSNYVILSKKHIHKLKNRVIYSLFVNHFVLILSLLSFYLKKSIYQGFKNR